MTKTSSKTRSAVNVPDQSAAVANEKSTLRLNASGVVLRGSGQEENATVLIAAGNSRRALIEIGGRGERIKIADTRQPITDAFVPIGAQKISVADAASFPVGTRVV